MTDQATAPTGTLIGGKATGLNYPAPSVPAPSTLATPAPIPAGTTQQFLIKPTIASPQVVTNGVANNKAASTTTISTVPQVKPQLLAPAPASGTNPPPLTSLPVIPISTHTHNNAARQAAARAAALAPSTTTVRPPLTLSNTLNNNNSSTTKPPSPKAKKSKKSTVTMATATTATPASGAAPSSGGAGENTGRWTAEEHRLFLQGLEQHGKGWKKIASLIKSRTVVQIRTHAQKYFQKLAKARQNGEEGEVSMEGRGVGSNGGTMAMGTGTAHLANGGTGTGTKRRRQTSGTKRKAIASVVASAQREGKRLAAASPTVVQPPLPAVAPALSTFVYPMPSQPSVPSITTSHGTISCAALENSLFRFLTPATGETHTVSPSTVPNPTNSPNSSTAPLQSNAQPTTITVPGIPGTVKTVQQPFGGDASPTGVDQIADFPTNWIAGDLPSWYAKGSDLDEILDEAETLDWLADSGDLDENYTPTPFTNTIVQQTTLSQEPSRSEPSLLSMCDPDDTTPNNVIIKSEGTTVIPNLAPTQALTTSQPLLNTSHAPNLEPNEVHGISPSSSTVNIPPLPSLFESGNSINKLDQTVGNGNGTSVVAIEPNPSKSSAMNLSSASLFAVGAAGNDSTENFNLLDDQLDEQAFVTALLDQGGESSNNLLNQ